MWNKYIKDDRSEGRYAEECSGSQVPIFTILFKILYNKNED